MTIPVYSETVPGAPLEEILCQHELEKRPGRAPNDQALYSAFKRLHLSMAMSPRTVLEALSHTILDLLHCDTAGVSLINDEQNRFYWAAIAGVWKPHVGGGTPRYFGPSADVLFFNRPLHMKQLHKRYTYFAPAALVNEVLIVPVYDDLHAVGTLWAVIHDPPDNTRSSTRSPQRYDLEDLRQLIALGYFASDAYAIWRKQPSGR